jgi:branched-chain amino acid transport system substrate-binding protein
MEKMIGRKLWRILIAIAIMLFVASGCSSSKDATSGKSSATVTSQASGVATGSSSIGNANLARKGEIVIGAVLPLTGASATIGADQQRGIDLAVAEVNQKGGVLGRKLRAVVEDSQGRAESAIDAATKLVKVDGAVAVVGEYSSGVTIPLGQYLQRMGVIHINPGSSSPQIAQIGDLSFSTIGLDNIAGKFTAEKVFGLGYRKIAFLAPNNAYGAGIYQEFKKVFEGLQGTVVEAVLYAEGQSDYRQELQRLSNAHPDLYVYTAYGQEAATINRQAYELGLHRTPWFGIYLSMCTADTDPLAAEGEIGMDVNFVGPNAQWYQKMYQNKYGQDFVTSFSGYTYDAVRLLVAAIEKAGSTDSSAIKQALPVVAQSYDGATGPIRFDNNGQRIEQPYVLLTYKNKKLTEWHP